MTLARFLQRFAAKGNDADLVEVVAQGHHDFVAAPLHEFEDRLDHLGRLQLAENASPKVVRLRSVRRGRRRPGTAPPSGTRYFAAAGQITYCLARIVWAVLRHGRAFEHQGHAVS